MTPYRITLSFFAIVCALAVGCSDDPTDVGFDLVSTLDSLRIETVEFQASSDTTFLKRITGSSTRLLAGKFAELEARSLIEFSNLPQIDSAAIIDSVTLSLPINYRFRESSGEFAVIAHRVTRAWDDRTFTWDSLAGSFDSTSIGSYVAMIMATDSMIRLRIDTSAMRMWSQAGNGTVLLVPTSPRAELVLGFSSFLVELKVHYRRDADTLVVSRRPSRAIFVANGDPPIPPAAILLQSSVAYRGLVRFDSLVVPPQASITRATLELTLDGGSSVTNSSSRDSIIAFLVRDTEFPIDSVELGSIGSPVTTGPGKIYRVDVRDIVQQWTNPHGRSNRGFAIHSFGEFTTFDRLVLHGARAGATLRPKLTVTYTLFP